MTYLIFGIVVMLVTWWITRDKYKKIIKQKENEIKDLKLKETIWKIEKFGASKRIEELKSELITQKAMKKNKN